MGDEENLFPEVDRLVKILEKYGVKHTNEEVFSNWCDFNQKIFYVSWFDIEGTDEELFAKYMGNHYNLFDEYNFSEYLKLIFEADVLIVGKFDDLDELGNEKDVSEHKEDVKRIKKILRDRGIKHTNQVILDTWKKISKNLEPSRWITLEGKADSFIYQIYRGFDVEIFKNKDDLASYLSIIIRIEKGGPLFSIDEIRFFV